jgi:hypothetical protein
MLLELFVGGAARWVPLVRRNIITWWHPRDLSSLSILSAVTHAEWIEDSGVFILFILCPELLCGCLPLKIQRIKKQFGTKDSKIQGVILKARRGLIQVQKHQEKKKNSVKCSKIKILKKRIKCRSSTNSNRKPLRNSKSQNSNFMVKSNSP